MRRPEERAGKRISLQSAVKKYLTSVGKCDIVSGCQRYRDIVQLVERWSPKPNVEGSSPSVPVQASESVFRSLLFWEKCGMTDDRTDEKKE